MAVLELEDLRDVVLCGASYGGMAVTGAADRVSDRIRLLLYVDALVPSDGQTGLDLLPESFRDLAHASAREHGDGWRVPIPNFLLPPAGWMPDREQERYVARLRDQPLATFTEPIRLTGAAERLPRGFIRCTRDLSLRQDLGGDPIASSAARAQREGWAYRELSAPHDCGIVEPLATARVLDELATPAKETGHRTASPRRRAPGRIRRGASEY